jgi:hypothetical protein
MYIGAYWCILVHNENFTILLMDIKIMAHSPIVPERKTVRTSVMLPEDAHLQLQILANANRVSSAWVIRMAVQRFLDEHQGQLELPLRLSARQGSDSNE